MPSIAAPTNAAKGRLYRQALTDGSAFASGWVAPPDM
jgi:hypothetical protein